MAVQEIQDQGSALIGPLHGNEVSGIRKAMHLGKSQLHRKIKDLTGKTPIQYLRSVKLNKAKSLLRSGANVSTVAFDLGYRDPKYFTRVFKDEYGVSPSDFLRGSSSD